MNVLISGASGEIGSAISKRFIENGFTVYSIDLADADLGNNFVNHRVDVTNVKALLKLKKELIGIKFSHIITLAGRALKNEWKDFSDSEYRTIYKSIELNLIGHLNVIRTFADQLDAKSNPSIVLVSSINAYGGFGLPIYSSAKAGLIGFMNSSKEEYAKKGIRINVIAPGTIVTPSTKKEPKDFEELLRATKTGRFATKEEVADLAYLICEESSITGKVKIIDEGQLEKKNGSY